MAVRFSADGQDYTRAIALGTLTAYTITCWGRIATDRNTYSTLWNLDNGINDCEVLQTKVDGTTMGIYADVSPATDIVNMTVGTWYFFAIARSGTGGTAYYRTEGQAGLTSVSLSGLSANVNAANLRIGESVFDTEWFNGRIAALQCYTGVALTASEILLESMRYVPFRLTNLAFWYPFVRPETADYSGNARTLSGGTGVAVEDGPAIPWYQSRPRLILPPATGAINVTLNRATESSTSRFLTPSHSVGLGKTTSTDTSRALTLAHNVPLLRGTETDTARGLTPTKQISLQRVTETDLARTLGAGQPINVALGRAAESDSSRSLTVAKRIPLNRTTETDLARPLTKSTLWNLLRATETESAKSLKVAKGVPFGRVTEQDIARTVSATQFQTVVLGRVTETDTARALSRVKGVVFSRAVETDGARLLVISHRISLSRAVELAQGRSLTFGRGVTLGRATEADVARVLAIAKRLILSRVVELDAARDLVIPLLNWPPGVGDSEGTLHIQCDQYGSVVAHISASSGTLVRPADSDSGQSP